MQTATVVPTTPQVSRKNMDRFMAATGKTEAEYYAYATEVGQRMHINSLDKLICAKYDMYTVSHLAFRMLSLPEGIDPDKIDEYILENSQNPLELAVLWKKTKANAESWISKESELSDLLKPFPKGDFETHGDPNWLPDVSKSWFKKQGANLDVQLMEINDTSSLLFTMDELIAFVRAYRPASYVNPEQQRLQVIEEKFKELTTFRIKPYYVEHLMKSCNYSETIASEDLPF